RTTVFPSFRRDPVLCWRIEGVAVVLCSSLFELRRLAVVLCFRWVLLLEFLFQALLEMVLCVSLFAAGVSLVLAGVMFVCLVAGSLLRFARLLGLVELPFWWLVFVWVAGGVCYRMFFAGVWYVFFYVLFVFRDWVVEDFGLFLLRYGFVNPIGYGSVNPEGSGY
ncbi:hypothetical protein A2U01_0043486, partial [Trifolium medium]|nr:hypothetical protein [Trifolium medium]